MKATADKLKLTIEITYQEAEELWLAIARRDLDDCLKGEADRKLDELEEAVRIYIGVA